MSNQEYVYMLECLREANERLRASANSIDDAISTVSSMEKRIEEFFLSGFIEDENDPDDEHQRGDEEN